MQKKKEKKQQQANKQGKPHIFGIDMESQFLQTRQTTLLLQL